MMGKLMYITIKRFSILSPQDMGTQYLIIIGDILAVYN